MVANKSSTIPIPAQMATALPVIPVTRPKQKIEPTRTSKTTQKLVVFPEADLEQETQEKILQDVAVDDLRSISSEPQFEKKLRRVTAYLTSESFRLRDFQDQCGKSLPCFTEAKRFDEVLYCPFFASPDKSIYSSPLDLETAVASSQPVGEVFIFDYGVIVIWGLEEPEERIILGMLKAFETDRLSPDDVEMENFYFCHNPDRPPRLFNDVINLRSGNYMVKLTISHALAQSVKLAYFEELIENTILHTRNIPIELSSSGNIRLSRKQINMQIGELFAMRMNVNLISNVLDTPELFWSYSSLGALYRAVRGYLEISQRVEVLNQRTSVLSDMLDMLRDHANITHAETLEWIVILLITLEVVIGLAKSAFETWYSK